MKNRFTILLRYTLLWLLFFITARLFFIIYNISYTDSIAFTDILKTFYYGILLDISITAYILFFATLLMVLISRTPPAFQKTIFWVYTLLLFVIVAIITVVDVELYRNWGFRMDATVLLYLKTPKESLASTRWYVTLMLLIFLGLTIWSGIKLYKKYVGNCFNKNIPLKLWHVPFFLIFMGALIIPIRGGTGIAPINQGRVYFSEHTFANHTALNVVWNFVQSVSASNKSQKAAFTTDNEAETLFNTLLEKSDTVNCDKLLNKPSPNILVIILESFTSNVIAPLDGIGNVTPGLNEWCKKGVLFTDFYASGDRSDKGLVSILSGYPAQPATSIIKYVNKTPKLPNLSADMERLGYHSGFYYGGDINFANMNSYFINGGYDTLVTLNNFSKSECNSKWGAHDHVVFNRLFNDLNNSTLPFFKVMFTLSSHDPYDVPYKGKFKGMDDESRFLNAVAYTDSCLTDFLERSENTDWWDNTWVILVADHGIRYPGNVSYSTPKKFAIPMLWTGGAITTDTLIDATCSQSDIPLMVMHQLGQTPKHYIFSKDVLAGDTPFAFYAFNNGFGFIKAEEAVVFDNTSNKIIEQTSHSNEMENDGKAFLQVLLNDFNAK